MLRSYSCMVPCSRPVYVDERATCSAAPPRAAPPPPRHPRGHAQKRRVPEAGMLSRCARTRRGRRGRGRSEAARARAPAPASVEAPSAWRSVERTAPTGKRARRLTGAGGRAHSRGGTRTHDHAEWRAGGWAGRRHLLCARCWWPGARAGKRSPPRRAPPPGRTLRICGAHGRRAGHRLRLCSGWASFASSSRSVTWRP